MILTLLRLFEIRLADSEIDQGRRAITSSTMGVTIRPAGMDLTDSNALIAASASTELNSPTSIKRLALVRRNASGQAQVKSVGVTTSTIGAQ